MTDEHTPTTAEVRACWGWDDDYEIPSPARNAEFDRWPVAPGGRQHEGNGTVKFWIGSREVSKQVAELWRAAWLTGPEMLYPACPSVSPSDQECIGRAEWHETHCDKFGSTWGNYASKVRGVEAYSTKGEEK